MFLQDLLQVITEFIAVVIIVMLIIPSVSLSKQSLLAHTINALWLCGCHYHNGNFLCILISYCYRCSYYHYFYQLWYRCYFVITIVFVLLLFSPPLSNCYWFGEFYCCWLYCYCYFITDIMNRLYTYFSSWEHCWYCIAGITLTLPCRCANVVIQQAEL